jgi:hypothetical protein
LTFVAAILLSRRPVGVAAAAEQPTWRDAFAERIA